MTATSQRDIYPMIRSTDGRDKYKQTELVSPTSTQIDLIKKEPIDVREVLTNSSEQINGVKGSICSIPVLEVHTCSSHKNLRDDDTKNEVTLMFTLF